MRLGIDANGHGRQIIVKIYKINDQLYEVGGLSGVILGNYNLNLLSLFRYLEFCIRWW